MIYCLNQARKLRKLSLNRATFPDKFQEHEVVQHFLSFDLESLFARTSDERRVLNLPLLTHINLFNPDGDVIRLLRGCTNLEVVVFNEWFCNLKSHKTDYSNWCLTDLPKFEEIEAVRVDVPLSLSYEASRVCLSFERNECGKNVRAHAQELFLLGKCVSLTETSSERRGDAEGLTWLYRDGFLGKDVQLSHLQIQSLGIVPKVVDPVDELLTRLCRVDEVELHLNALRRSGHFGADFSEFSTSVDYIQSFVSKPSTLNRQRLVLSVNWDETNTEYQNFRDTLARMNLRSVALGINSDYSFHPCREEEYAEYEFSWLQASGSSLETFKVFSRYWYYPLNWDRVGLESFTVLSYISFKGVKLKKRDVAMLGLLPALETLSLGESLLHPDDTDIVKLSSGTSRLFSTLRVLYLYTIEAVIESRDVGLDSDNGINKFNEYNCLLTGKMLETVVLTELRDRPRDKNEVKLIDPETWIRDCSLNCVDLDLSGSCKLITLEALDAPRLKRLVLNGCKELRSLHGIQRSSRLEILFAGVCPILRCTKSLKSLKGLRVVTFQGSSSLEVDSFEFVKEAENLIYLNIRDCGNGCYSSHSLRGVAAMFTQKPYLTLLDFRDFDALVGENGEGGDNLVNVHLISQPKRKFDFNPFLEANEREECPNSMSIIEKHHLRYTDSESSDIEKRYLGYTDRESSEEDPTDCALFRTVCFR